MDLFSQLWLVCVTSGLAPPSLLHGAGSMDSPGTTPCTPFLLLELWGLGFTSWWGLSSHLPEMYSEISFWALLLRLPLPTSSTWIFTAGWHVHLSMVPRLRSLLLCEDGVYVSTSHLPCCLEVISERRRKKCQLYVTLVMLGVDCPSRYYCNSVAGKWFRVKGGPARCQEGLSLQAQRRPGSDENGLTDKWAPSLWQPPIGQALREQMQLCLLRTQNPLRMAGTPWPSTCSVDRGARVFILQLQMAQPRVRGEKRS